MTATPALRKSKKTPTEMRIEAQDGVGVGLGVLWIVGAAIVWNVLLVLLHDLIARLLP